MNALLPPMNPALVQELSDRILTIAREVLRDDLEAMIVKGSAIKGDFIPDFSDFDVHIFANDRVMRAPLAPRSEVVFAFQESFAEIDVPSYRVSQIQVMFVSASNHPPEWIPALPGTYRLIHGELPGSLPEATPEMLRQHAVDGLVRSSGWIDTLLARMPDKPDDKLADTVRLAGSILKGALYEAAVTLGHHPFETWSAPLSEVLDVVEPALMPARPASRYYARASRWADVRGSGPELRAMARNGVDALEALAEFGRQKQTSTNS